MADNLRAGVQNCDRKIRKTSRDRNEARAALADGTALSRLLLATDFTEGNCSRGLKPAKRETRESTFPALVKNEFIQGTCGSPQTCKKVQYLTFTTTIIIMVV